MKFLPPIVSTFPFLSLIQNDSPKKRQVSHLSLQSLHKIDSIVVVTTSDIMGQTHSPPSSSRVMRVLPQHHSSSRIGSHSPQHLLSSIPPIEEENDSRKDEDSTFLCPRRSQEVSLSSSPKHSTSNHHNRTTTTTSPRLANRGGGYGGHGGMPQTISGSSHESHEEREGKWFSSVSSENFELKSPRGMMTMGHSSCMQHLKQKMIMMMVYGSNHVSYSGKFGFYLSISGNHSYNELLW